MIARKRQPRRRLSWWRDAAWSVALFLVMFIVGLAVGGFITGRGGW